MPACPRSQPASLEHSAGGQHETCKIVRIAYHENMQVDGQVLRVGSTQTRTVDVRVLAATQRNLEERVQQGLFRQDLYYRLAVVPIHMLPLRERKEDIPGLCEILSSQIAKDLKVRPKRVSPEALQKITNYAFPGNIRELRNLLERAHILGQREDIAADELPVDESGHTAQEPQKMEMCDWLRTLPPQASICANCSPPSKGASLSEHWNRRTGSRLKQLGCLDCRAATWATKSQNMREGDQWMPPREEPC